MRLEAAEMPGRMASHGPGATMLVVVSVAAERRALAHLERSDVALAVTGMGALTGARRARDLLGSSRRALIAAGFCGAIDPALRVGDVIVAERVVDEMSGETFLPDPGLLTATTGRRGTLVTAARLVRTPAQRARIAGDACDMESAALARVAAAAGVPFVAIRAVTDEAGHTLPDFDRLSDAAGRLTPGLGLIYFLTHPREVPRLLRLGPAARRAGRSLAAAVATTLESA